MSVLLEKSLYSDILNGYDDSSVILATLKEMFSLLTFMTGTIGGVEKSLKENSLPSVSPYSLDA